MRRLRRGLSTGLVGAAAVAIWFLLLDFLAGHPFRTPAALGAGLLLGAPEGRSVTPNAGIVAAYTVIHLVAFWACGIVFVAVAEQFARWSPLLPVTLPFAMVLEAVAVAAMALGARLVLGELGFWAVFVGNVLAVGSMGWYVWWTQPAFRQRLRSGGS